MVILESGVRLLLSGACIKEDGEENVKVTGRRLEISSLLKKCV